MLTIVSNRAVWMVRIPSIESHFVWLMDEIHRHISGKHMSLEKIGGH